MSFECNEMTSATFVGRLSKVEGDSWDEFYSLYAPMIIAFAKKQGCPDVMAEDVLQETIVALYRILPTFDYDRSKGRFRSFLFRVTSSKVIDAYRRGKALVSIDDSELIDKFNSDIEPSTEMTTAWGETWDNNVLGIAIDTARQRVKPLTYECFDRTYINGEQPVDVAADLGIDANLVYQHRHKVQKIIIEVARATWNEIGD